jgi:hypothetical protein
LGCARAHCARSRCRDQQRADRLADHGVDRVGDIDHRRQFRVIKGVDAAVDIICRAVA